MRKLFVVLVIALLVLGFGFYRGWFRTDKDRIRQDEQTAIEKAKDIGGRVTEGIQKGVDKLREGTQK